MSRRCILLCEDQRHAMFVRRFLFKKGWRVLDVNMAPSGEGAAEQHVRKEYPEQLEAARKRNIALVVMIDGDDHGAEKRMRQLEKRCQEKKVAVRQKTDAVAVFVPEQEIEDWIRYLEGKADADKSECKKMVKPAVKKLLDICARNDMPDDFPCSLKRACGEWRRFL